LDKASHMYNHVEMKMRFEDMPRGREAVLVGVITRKRDLEVLDRERWYRIPVASTPEKGWPPRWFAAYETQLVAGGPQVIRRFARVLEIEQRSREELFPGEPAKDRAGKMYHKLILGPVRLRETPITVAVPRRLVFISTTGTRFSLGRTVNDLYYESALEDRLWKALQRQGITAERQWPETVEGRRYFLDFAVFCTKANIDVEVDGDRWHANPVRAAADNERDNSLASVGWRTLRFSTSQVRDMLPATMERLAKTVRSCGGIVVEGMGPHRFLHTSNGTAVQLALGESAAPYDGQPFPDDWD
jgi:very-short-patch-repair endonuclease